MALKVIISLLFVAHLAAGFTHCETSKWANHDVSVYNALNIKNLKFQDPKLGVSREDVLFRLWTRSQESNYAPIYFGQLDNEPTIRPEQPFKIIIHGWTDCADSTWYEKIKNEYLKKDDYNVILVDWTKPAGAIYPLSVTYTKTVGKFVGELIVDLNQTLDVPFENIHLVGHSLGAHISGFAGQYVLTNTNQNVGRITGMDPAGPLFLLASSSNRLSKEDALYVDIIHTDGGKFGYKKTLGHADFYPNGGAAPQPGCMLYNVVDVASCSHTRSYWLFAESINSVGFVSKECPSFSEYEKGQCAENKEAVMGQNIEIGVEGVFYLTTNGVSPFARNGEILNM